MGRGGRQIVVDAVPSSDCQLVLARIIDLPREKLYRAWTETELIRQWLTPRPWTVSSARAEVRAAAPA